MDEIIIYSRRRGPTSAPVTPPPEHTGRSRGRAQLRSISNVSSSLENQEQMAQGSSGAGSSKAAKILSSVRRSLSYGAPSKRRSQSIAVAGMHSTAVESLPPLPTAHSFSDDGALSPSIEQIAMGLHISRTPHLGPSRGHPPLSRHKTSFDVPRSPSNLADRPTHHRRGSVPVLPPPPARSSMKKPPSSQQQHLLTASPASGTTPLSSSGSSVSLSTLTSTAPSTPRSNRSVVSVAGFSSRLQLSMNKLLVSPRRKDSASPPLSDTSSTPRKVVRFTPLEE